MAPRLALKLDVDTFEGTRSGVPRLLDLFARKGIVASIYFSLGPDNSGRALRRIWERPGFLAKQRRMKATSTYGLRTILSGTLLPSRDIGPVAAPLLRRAEAEGHEVAVHAWDHVEWHDRLPRWSVERVRQDFARSFAAFETALARRPRAVAAPGWMMSAAAFEVEDELGLAYASDGRGNGPFRPVFAGRSFRTLQLPSTLPTWDEVAGRLPDGTDLVAHYRGLVGQPPSRGGAHVHTIHAEVEGGSLAAVFERLVEAWLADGVRFTTLEQLAREVSESPDAAPPEREVVMREIEGRAGEVAVEG